MGALSLLSAVAVAAESTKLEATIRKANSEWAAAMKTGDAATIAAPYTDTAIFVLVDGTVIKGRAAIENMYRTGFERAGIATSTKIVSAKVVRDGDLAYESGYGEVGIVAGGKPTVRHSRYLTVWQRQSDDEWKIIRNLVLPWTPKARNN